MARVTVEDCLKQIDNCFDLVVLAAHRAKRIIVDQNPQVEVKNNKAPVLALREIAQGVCNLDLVKADTVKFLKNEGEYSLSEDDYTKNLFHMARLRDAQMQFTKEDTVEDILDDPLEEEEEDLELSTDRDCLVNEPTEALNDDLDEDDLMKDLTNLRKISGDEDEDLSEELDVELDKHIDFALKDFKQD